MILGQRWRCLSTKTVWFLVVSILPLEFSPTSMVSCGNFEGSLTDPRVPTPSSTNFTWGKFRTNKNRVGKNCGSKYPFCLVQVKSHFIHVLLIGSFANKNTYKLQLPFKSRTMKKIVPWKCWWLNSYKNNGCFPKYIFFNGLGTSQKQVYVRCIPCKQSFQWNEKNLSKKKHIAVRFHRENVKTL